MRGRFVIDCCIQKIVRAADQTTSWRMLFRSWLALRKMERVKKHVAWLEDNGHVLLPSRAQWRDRGNR